jgi:outer membrane protein assembly factor BamE
LKTCGRTLSAQRHPVTPLSFKQKLIPLVALLAGCQYVPMLPGISPYQIDIQQGNYVTQDMLDKVKPGMSKAQVRFALGTPLVVDPFHNDRWDYVYELKKRGRRIEYRRMVVHFADDKLLRVEGDVAPAMRGSSASAETSVKGGPAAAAAADEAPRTPAPAPSGSPIEPAAPSGPTGPADNPVPR